MYSVCIVFHRCGSRMPGPRRSGPGVWALTLLTESSRSSLLGQGRETELREAHRDNFFCFLKLSSFQKTLPYLRHRTRPLSPTSHLAVHPLPVPLCCQTRNLNTPKRLSHNGPKKLVQLQKCESVPTQTHSFSSSYSHRMSCLLPHPPLPAVGSRTTSPMSRHWTKTKRRIYLNNQMPQRPKSILQVCDLTAQLDLLSTSLVSVTDSLRALQQTVLVC